MKWRTKAVIALVLLVGVLWVACAPAPRPERLEGRPLKRIEERIMAGPRELERGVYRFHDPRFNVTCWIYYGYRAGGISCLPDDVVER